MPALKSAAAEPRRTRTVQPLGSSSNSPAVTKTATHSQTPEEARKAFLLRVSPELMKEIEAWAQAEMRSINGQIEYLLRQAVNERKKR